MAPLLDLGLRLGEVRHGKLNSISGGHLRVSRNLRGLLQASHRRKPRHTGDEREKRQQRYRPAEDLRHGGWSDPE